MSDREEAGPRRRFGVIVIEQFALTARSGKRVSLLRFWLNDGVTTLGIRDAVEMRDLLDEWIKKVTA